jgi:hypothetical protein
MIGNSIRIHHHTETVDNADQAVSLAEYFNQHGMLAFQEADDAVMVAIEAADEEQAATQERLVHILRTTWGLFWEHSDKGLFGLPIYVKD